MRAAIFDYKKKWGLADIQSAQLINKIIENHVIGADDLNQADELDTIIREAHSVYKTDADSAEIRNLSKMKYRRNLRHDISKFADEIKRKY